MHIETRIQARRRKYYLTHNFRDGGRVRKLRVYMGSNLSMEDIKKLRPQAEASIRLQFEELKRIRYPLNTVLSTKEIEEISNLTSGSDMQIRHLSEKDWKMFAELFTYDTNAIEGSTVTQTEVVGILEKDRWPDRSKYEISETYGVSEAINHIRKTKEQVSLQLMKELHEIAFRNSKPFAGKFRGKGIEVGVVDSSGSIIHRGAPQKQVVPLLNEFIKWYNKSKGKYHPLLLAAVVHNQFENIHPFQDGNGRVGRLLLNNILIKHGLPPVNIELKHRLEYYSALHEYQKDGNIRPTIELIINEYRELKRKLDYR